MTIREANAIRITDYLANLGYSPSKQVGDKIWYLSPLRKETTPSFKVNDLFNSWYDFGLGEGGNLFELAKKIYDTNDFGTILNKIEETMNGIFRRIDLYRANPRTIRDQIPFSNWRTQPLQNRRLIAYLKSRKISIEIADRYCEEAYYSIGDNSYYAIVFHNDSEGYEIRNQYFKGCYGNKDVTTIFSSPEEIKLPEHCCVFEGFMDFLSYLNETKNNDSKICLTCPCDYLVLNSVSMTEMASEALMPYKVIHCYLDNDEAGRLATQKLAQSFNIVNEARRYMPFKDVNEYLCARQEIQ